MSDPTPPATTEPDTRQAAAHDDANLEPAAGIRFPHITVQLTGNDGNAYAIIGRIAGALRRQAGADAADAFTNAAFACGSYDELLCLAMDTVTVL